MGYIWIAVALEASVRFLEWQLLFMLLRRRSVSYETRVKQNTDRATVRNTSGIIEKYLPFQEFIKKPKWRIVSDNSQVGKGKIC